MPESIVKPESLRELWRLLPRLASPRRYLAGGTDLVNAAGSGPERGEIWVDISGLKELSGIKETRASVVIGACVKIAEIGRSPLIAYWLPVLASAVPHFASPSLRNMATIGGNAANASPCADAVCALCAEKAEIWLERGGRKRKMPLPDFFNGPKRTALEKDELITAFEIPKRAHSGAYMKLGPREYFCISKAAVAAALEMEGKTVRSASIALASVAPIPLMARKTASYLAGRILNEENVRTAAALAKTEAAPITDIRSEADYRREMSGELLERALNSISNASSAFKTKSN